MHNNNSNVFNPNVTFQSNCAEGLHFSAFHSFRNCIILFFGTKNLHLERNLVKECKKESKKVRKCITSGKSVLAANGNETDIILHNKNKQSNNNDIYTNNKTTIIFICPTYSRCNIIITIQRIHGFDTNYINKVLCTNNYWSEVLELYMYTFVQQTEVNSLLSA